MFKEELNNILVELNTYKRDKSQLLTHYVQTRLSKSLVTYYNELIKTCAYVHEKDQLKVLKSLNKEG